MAPEWASSGVPLIIFLFFVVLGRSQATYWLARFAAAGAIAGMGRGGLWEKIAAWFNGPIPRKGAGLLEKWGIIIIPLCFLTVGLQTAVIAGAGLVRLRWLTYTLASIPGCIAWALLYGLGLLAVWMTAIGAIAGSPWAWAAILALIIGGGIALILRRRRAAYSLSDEGGA
ncbi:MAG: hypothetical protein Q4C87_03915 [Actinomycetaceae bacterium]|nr:hypothetical protein [Actinomycetaceae bacterium]